MNGASDFERYTAYVRKRTYPEMERKVKTLLELAAYHEAARKRAGGAGDSSETAQGVGEQGTTVETLEQAGSRRSGGSAQQVLATRQHGVGLSHEAIELEQEKISLRATPVDGPGR